MNLLIIIGAAALLGLITIFAILSRFKKCPSDKILVVYGKTGKNKSAKCVHGGAAFIWPIIQGYTFIDLKPFQITCNLTDAISKQNIRVAVPAIVTAGVSTEPNIMQNAAERILNMNEKTLSNLVQDIVFGQLRAIVANMDVAELISQRDKLISEATMLVNTELNKIGLKLINVNFTDIKDEAGMIVAWGQRDKAAAINQANVDVATADKRGAIDIAEQRKIQDSTVAETNKLKDVAVATANSQKDSQVAEQVRDRDISVAKAESEGRIGEIAAEQTVVDKDAELKITRAEAMQRAETANVQALAQVEKNRELAQVEVVKAEAKREEARVSVVQAEAKVEQEKELARKIAEEARAQRNEAALTADKIVPADIAKKEALLKAEAYQLELEKKAEANANTAKITAQGEANAKAANAEGEKRARVFNAQAVSEAAVLEGKGIGEGASLQGKGEGEGILARGQAEAEVIRLKGLAAAEGERASAIAQAEGFAAMVQAGEQNPQLAVQYKMVTEGTFNHIADQQAIAMKSLNFGNVQVMDTTHGGALWAQTAGNILDKVMPIAGMISDVFGKKSLPETK